MSLLLKFKNRGSGAKPESLGCVGTAFLLVFGIGFSGAGLFVLSSNLASLREYYVMKSWREVPAQILEAQVTSHSGSDSGTTYGIGVKYEYEFDGTTRQGTRADLFPKFTEGSGRYQRRIVTQLQAARSGRRAVPCYVNPANPAEAVLDREMRWGVFAGMTLFCLPFCAVGFGALAALVLYRRYSRAKAASQALYPDEPWRWQRDWASGEIRSSSKSGAIGLTLFAAFWNSIAFLPLILSGKDLFTSGPSREWLVLLFPAVGVALIVVTARAWRTWAVLGNAVFRMSRVPGVLGGVLTGTILSRCGGRPDSEVWLTLTCAENHRSGHGDNHEHILWQDRRAVRPEAVHLEPMGLSLPVLFQIPYDCVESPRSDNERIHWRLDLEGQFGGAAGKARFVVPVFKTAASDPNLKPDRSLEARLFKAPAPAEILKAAAVSIEPLPGGGRRYHFRPNRPMSMVLFLSIFTLIWTAVSVGLWFFHGPLVLRIIFPLFDLIPLLALVDILLWSGRADVTPQGVTFAGGILNKQKTVFVAVEDIQRFSLKNGMSSGEQIYYNLLLETRSGKKVTLGKRLRERSHGEWLIEEMEKDVLGEQSKVRAELHA